jgi:hypothetical protein
MAGRSFAASSVAAFHDNRRFVNGSLAGNVLAPVQNRPAARTVRSGAFSACDKANRTCDAISDLVTDCLETS